MSAHKAKRTLRSDSAMSPHRRNRMRRTPPAYWRSGAFIFVGNGDSAGLHHPAYDFNDEPIPLGTSYWVRLAETALAA